MLTRLGVAAGFLVFLAVPLWRWLQQPYGPDATPVGGALNGWMLAAYGIIYTALITYGLLLDDRAARAGVQASWLRRVFEQLAMMSLMIGAVLALVYAPIERTMGPVQKIFYIHVPSAWVAYLAYAVVFVGSVLYLLMRSEKADRVARSSAEVGVVFTSLVLVSGPIWARPVWGIWWTWDMRLTLTLVLWLVYVGYLMLRAQLFDAQRKATLCAVIGILGFVGVPINYMAIRWWRTQHPAPVIGGGEGSGLHPMMLRAYLFNLLAFTLLYLALLWRRMEVARAEDEAEERLDEKAA